MFSTLHLKKLFPSAFYFVLLLNLILNQNAFSATWENISKNENVEYSFDKESIIGSAKNKEISIKVNILKDPKEGDKSRLLRFLINCSTSTLLLDEIKRYSEFELKGVETVFKGNATETTPKPNTVGQRYIDIACGASLNNSSNASTTTTPSIQNNNSNASIARPPPELKKSELTTGQSDGTILAQTNGRSANSTTSDWIEIEKFSGVQGKNKFDAIKYGSEVKGDGNYRMVTLLTNTKWSDGEVGSLFLTLLVDCAQKQFIRTKQFDYDEFWAKGKLVANNSEPNKYFDLKSVDTGFAYACSAKKVSADGTAKNEFGRLLKQQKNYEANQQSIQQTIGECKNLIKRKYESTYKDQYGNTSSSKMEFLNFLHTFPPGGHKYGNNNSHFFSAVVEKYEGGRLKDNVIMKIHCITNDGGKILGVERQFD